MAIHATKPATPAAVAAKEQDIGSAATMHPSVDPAAAEGEPRLPPGTMVSDRYRIERVLGEGGMGVVYAAEHVLMRKEVALKVLHAEMCTMEEVVARFEREAIAAAHIDHPNVAAATDFGRLPDGSCFLVLELLRGGSLRSVIGKGALPFPRALRVLRGITSGVAAAHAKGIVHRDLKPENVMLVDRDGDPDFVKVLDFGIAKVDPSAAAAPQAGGKILTRIGTVFGTPEYMAPEQALGDTVDARADLYSIGVIFLEMLTGTCPFQGNALSILRDRILSVGPPDLSAVADAGARDLITRLLTRHPADRMQTATELLAAIDAHLGERGSALPVRASASPWATPIGAAVSIAEEPAPSRRWLVPVAAVAFVSICAGAIGVIALADRKPDIATTTAPTAEVAAPPPVASESAPPTSAEKDDVVDDVPVAPAPTASAASARAPRAKAAPKRHAPQKKSSGIYIPPPNTWFK